MEFLLSCIAVVSRTPRQLLGLSFILLVAGCYAKLNRSSVIVMMAFLGCSFALLLALLVVLISLHAFVMHPNSLGQAIVCIFISLSWGCSLQCCLYDLSVDMFCENFHECIRQVMTLSHRWIKQCIVRQSICVAMSSRYEDDSSSSFAYSLSVYLIYSVLLTLLWQRLLLFVKVKSSLGAC